MPTKHHLLCLTLLLALAGCADTPAPSTDETGINDPLETMNRRSFDNNHFLDRLLLRPLAELYRVTVPPPVRDRITGILANMNEPTIFANDVMQGEFGKAGTTFERLAINSTLGIGGMWDVATGWGMQKQTGDFGQTLASWGVGEGPYLMLPLVGPSDLRDAFGRGVDTA
ncbi:MAG TPA: VacJ family lipoprotein, partial [Alphaproteobacteria bacterium]|nr:VacJ family lipoprotein [Alphaproteobacteria bacterium]